MRKPHILLVEPYYGGSHRQFIEGLIKHLDLECTLLSLPARKWKMRMQTAAPWMAERIIALHSQGNRWDAVLCSTFIDCAVLRALLAAADIHLPLGIYFHENQFAYPSRVRDPGMFQFTCINWTSALVADRLYFNSRFNRDSFLAGISRFVKKAADVDLSTSPASIRQKSIVLHPGIEFCKPHQPEDSTDGVPVILWNHRWEHDKDPEQFFAALLALQADNIPFGLIVLGENFRDRPGVFAEAQKQLRSRIIHFGYAESREEYCRLLGRGDIVVSTALHEFFGIAVLEAVHAGCRPLVPDTLSYPELYPEQYRYPPGRLEKALRRVLGRREYGDRAGYCGLAARFSWQECRDRYHKVLGELTAVAPCSSLDRGADRL